MTLFRGWDMAIGESFGTKIITSLEMTKLVEDWSRVRSPGRARRRLKQGHKQNIEYRRVPRRDALMLDGGRTMVVHPETLRAIGEYVGKAMEQRMDRLLLEGMFGPAGGAAMRDYWGAAAPKELPLFKLSDLSKFS